MANIDIFSNNAFSVVEMSRAIDNMPFRPERLGQLGLFDGEPIRTTDVWIESRDGALTLVPTTRRGEPLPQNKRDPRNARAFKTNRIAKGDRITAEEIQNIRAFGSSTELEQVDAEVGRRLNGPSGIRSDVELTHEHMRLGCIQGQVLDADGSVLHDWFDEWGITAAAATSFALNDGTTTLGELRQFCQTIRRDMRQRSKGAWVVGRTSVHALCGDEFFDKLVTHPAVESTYLSHAAAAELRGQQADTFTFGGITFENYLGTDDGSTVSVGTTEARFFPVGSPGVFRHVMSPLESFEYANTPGQNEYAMTIMDEKRDFWADVEVYSYPLYICTRPQMLLTGTVA